ncbi:MAG: sulfatase-like hydrolase/transferase, partial [Acidobacteria bacterium]|nr:sulfatase-like hydrolase/transferase [Acidobacteriota bacterium]
MPLLTRRSLLHGAAALPLAAAPRPRPNVIVILADDLGYADVGFTGAKDIPTPNIDRIARAGVRFTNAYVSHPFCSPTRAGLMTGRYQQRFGHENNPRYDPNDRVSGLPADQVTLAQVLSEAGYATGIAGKWHLGATPEMHPLRRGFREQFGFIGGGHDYFKAGGVDERREYFIPFQRDGKPVAESEYLTDALSREAGAFVRRHAGDPFFLYVAYNAPHTPQQVTEKYLGRFAGIQDPQRRNYAAMISAMDDGIGGLLDTIDELKLGAETLIFFLSDNGGPVGINGSSNQPFRGAKGTLYEGGIALAGAKNPAGVKLDGVDLMPHLTGKAKRPPHERLFWRTGGGVQYAVREGRYKLYRNEDGAQLYDLEADPGETRDVAAEHKDVFERLERAR